jgi:hypothetical protein
MATGANLFRFGAPAAGACGWLAAVLLLLVPVTVAACGSSGERRSPDAGSDAVSQDAPANADAGPGADGDAHGPADGSTDGPMLEPGGDAAPFVPGMPITATANQWTWIPFPNAVCANGAATGIGINPSTTSPRVLIYLEGGGGCWDELTCYTLMTASYVSTGYGAAEFAAESTDVTYLAEPGGFFDRAAAANPFKDYSYVYIPYCTGDIFAGNNVTVLGTTTTSFVGYRNVSAFLSRIVPTFPAADRVILAGSSAGGYGAMYNFWQTQAAFGSIRVDVLDDSGTFMPPDVTAQGNGAQTTQATVWNLASTFPPCVACATDLSAIYGFYATSEPGHRGALLSYSMDSVLPLFYGITTAQFATGLDEDLASGFTPNANMRAFVVGAAGHVLFFNPTLTSNGVTLQTFLTQMVTDDPTWATEHP